MSVLARSLPSLHRWADRSGSREGYTVSQANFISLLYRRLSSLTLQVLYLQQPERKMPLPLPMPMPIRVGATELSIPAIVIRRHTPS